MWETVFARFLQGLASAAIRTGFTRSLPQKSACEMTTRKISPLSRLVRRDFVSVVEVKHIVDFIAGIARTMILTITTILFAIAAAIPVKKRMRHGTVKTTFYMSVTIAGALTIRVVMNAEGITQTR